MQSQPSATGRTAATNRQQRKAERVQQRREQRVLRNTPKSQRAAKREEIKNAREQRAEQRREQSGRNAARSNDVQTTGTAQANDRAQRRAERRAARNGGNSARVTPAAARQGRFGARFAARNQSRADWRARHHRYAAHRAWRHGLRAAFVPWYGPVFWPYAYSDIFDYAFWPGGYEDGYWDYAYDGFVDSLFWGEEGPPAEYVYADPYTGSGASATTPRVRHAAVEELCTQPGNGITAWPFADIERKVGLNGDQKGQLGDVRNAAKKAAAEFKTSCPSANAFPLTPPGRLQAMMARLEATRQAVASVRPALEAFYNSLSDEQKERFNEIGPRGSANAEAKQALPADNKSCAEAKPGLTNLPIDRIDASVNPTDAQEKSLDQLDDATTKAVSILQAACPDATPLTPPGRLQAMEKRLQAMIEAANTVKPALEDFYGSLSSEQKARFNRIGKEVASKS